ncbi:hypothetical protein ACJMK2_011813 [Sinanodonta woodiana]|uniref:Uncharacterized protein n=1 Tax=Sinanodonta woodiana TaxID=1069815 RepID=A0ABD3V8H2_SINWO
MNTKTLMMLVTMYVLVFCKFVEPCTDPTDWSPVTNTFDFFESTKMQAALLLPRLAHSTRHDFLSIPQQYVNIVRNETLWGQQSCRPHIAVFDNHLHSTSVCPWYFVKNVDNNRKPEVLVEAMCACSDLDMSHVGINGKRIRCRSVPMFLRVLRRTGCKDGLYTYRFVWEKISVGCVATYDSLEFIDEKPRMNS